MPSRFIELQRVDPRANRIAFINSVREGLSSTPKKLSSEFFYNAEGSSIFNKICCLPEYYLTRAEKQILELQSDAIIALIDSCAGKNSEFGSRNKESHIDLIELGAGSSGKTEVFAKALVHQRRVFTYIPIDICREAMIELDQSMNDQFGNTAFKMQGVVAEYQTGLEWLDRQDSSHQTILLFLGSNIGNLSRSQAVDFLTRVKGSMKIGDVLVVGIDKKPHAAKSEMMIRQAYDDSAGITAEFNYNLLRRINTELNAHFDVSQFKHMPYYDVAQGGMISRLMSLHDQDVEVKKLRTSFHFSQGEFTQTEMSLKYDRRDVELLAEQACFTVIGEFTDPAKLFGVYVLRA